MEESALKCVEFVWVHHAEQPPQGREAFLRDPSLFVITDVLAEELTRHRNPHLRKRKVVHGKGKHTSAQTRSEQKEMVAWQYANEASERLW